MSYRIWWLIAFWALGVGVSIELEALKGDRSDGSRAEVRGAPATVAARTATVRGG